MSTLPTMPGPVCSTTACFCLRDVRYRHIPVRKSLGWPTSIQNPERKNATVSCAVQIQLWPLKRKEKYLLTILFLSLVLLPTGILIVTKQRKQTCDNHWLIIQSFKQSLHQAPTHSYLLTSATHSFDESIKYLLTPFTLSFNLSTKETSWSTFELHGKQISIFCHLWKHFFLYGCWAQL